MRKKKEDKTSVYIALMKYKGLGTLTVYTLNLFLSLLTLCLINKCYFPKRTK
jgi:hypothetical protein